MSGCAAASASALAAIAAAAAAEVASLASASAMRLLARIFLPSGSAAASEPLAPEPLAPASGRLRGAACARTTSHLRCLQLWRLVPGPPKAGMSKQLEHSPQLARKHPAHAPHLDERARPRRAAMETSGEVTVSLPAGCSVAGFAPSSSLGTASGAPCALSSSERSSITETSSSSSSSLPPTPLPNTIAFEAIGRLCRTFTTSSSSPRWHQANVNAAATRGAASPRSSTRSSRITHASGRSTCGGRLSRIA